MALLACMFPTALADAKAHALFFYDGPSSQRGQSEAVCDAVGIQLPTVPFELHVAQGRLTTRATLVNRTVVGPEKGLVAQEGPTDMHEDPSEIPTGVVRVRPVSSSVLVGLPYGYARGPAATFSVEWNATEAKLSAPGAGLPTPAGRFWMQRGEAIVAHESAFLGWARLVRLHGTARADGDLTLYLREVDVEWVGRSEHLGPYVTETENVSTPMGSHRTLRLTDAFLDMRGVSWNLPPGAEPVCRAVRARINGTFTAEGATGTLPTPEGRATVTGRAITLAGDFALDESSAAQDPVGGARGRTASEADGHVGLVAVDFDELAPVTPSPAVVTTGLVAALLVGAVSVARFFGTFVGFFYSRFGRDRALDNPNRELVYEAVCHNPGADLSTLAQITGMNRRTVAYHVQVLTRVGLVGTRRHGKSRRVLPTHLTGSAAVASTLAIQDPRYAQIVEVLRAGPLPLGELVRALQKRLELRRRGAYRVVERAIGHGIVRRSEDGREVRLACDVLP